MVSRTGFILKMCFFVGLALNSLFVQAITPISINKETPQYIINIKYPQGFKTSAINHAINDFIVKAQKNFMNELAEDTDTPTDAPGKTGLNITYSIPYQTQSVVSVRFNVSIYHRGAAHPANTIVVENFINGREVTLADLFVSDADYLQTIAHYSKDAITAKKISDEKWIDEGTKPTIKNYAIWYFTSKGITLIFDTYQVAAYVYGPQTVAIPVSLISTLIKPEIVKAVWSH